METQGGFPGEAGPGRMGELIKRRAPEAERTWWGAGVGGSGGAPACLTPTLPQGFSYGECRALPSPWALVSFPGDVVSMPQVQGDGTQRHLVHLFLLESPAFSPWAAAEPQPFCPGPQVSLSGPCVGFSLGSGEEFLSQPRSDGLCPQVGHQAAMIITFLFIKHLLHAWHPQGCGST